jgi:hypothetical protein
MSSRQTATFQEALDIVESLPEYQQEDLINIIQRRHLARIFHKEAQTSCKSLIE